MWCKHCSVWNKWNWSCSALFNYWAVTWAELWCSRMDEQHWVCMIEGDGWADVWMTWNRFKWIDSDDPSLDSGLWLHADEVAAEPQRWKVASHQSIKTFWCFVLLKVCAFGFSTALKLCEEVNIIQAHECQQRGGRRNSSVNVSHHDGNCWGMMVVFQGHWLISDISNCNKDRSGWNSNSLCVRRRFKSAG